MMLIFPDLKHDNIVQVDDKLRLDASKSFSVNGEEITDVEIRPEQLSQFISVYSPNKTNWYLDYAYSNASEKEVTVRVTTTNGQREKTYTLLVITEKDDALLSEDNDLISYENKIYNYLPSGKNSFKYAHRSAQRKILYYLDEKRIWRHDGSAYTKADLVQIKQDEFREQFRLWSLFQTLLIILESNQVTVGDLFEKKIAEYRTMRNNHRDRASLLLDGNNDKEATKYEKEDIKTGHLVRR